MITMTKSYLYLGKNGKPILARQLEDERDAAFVLVAEMKKFVSSVPNAQYLEAQLRAFEANLKSIRNKERNNG